jgi:hypothetical protein
VNEVEAGLRADLHIARFHAQHIRELYIVFLQGRWLCEGCGAVQEPGTDYYPTVDNVWLCMGCHDSAAAADQDAGKDLS